MSRLRNSFVLLVGAGVAVDAEVAIQAAPSAWSRVLLTNASVQGAVCLDGSPGGYYIRTADSTGAKMDPAKWVIFMEGGGWCGGDENCLERSKMDLGSSKGWPEVPTGLEDLAMFNLDAFKRHTIVYAKYCDGGSFTGALSNPPVRVGTEVIYRRGRGLRDGLFDHLFTEQGLSRASELLYAGCSAGALTTYLHADWVTDQMKQRAPSAKVVALADAMFSLNSPNVNGSSNWPELMQTVFSSNDPNGEAMNQACVNNMSATYGGRKEAWRCMFGSVVVNFVQTPLFVLNSKYDTWQAKQIIGAGGCANNIAKCADDVKGFWVDYGRRMEDMLDRMPSRHGAFVHNCQTHCHAWSPSMVVNGTSLPQAATTWYQAALRGEQANIPRHIDRCDVSPCPGDSCNGQAAVTVNWV